MIDKKLYATAICFVFQICGLYLAFAGLSWGQLFLIFTFVICLLSSIHKRKLVIDKRYICIVVYTLIQTLIILLINNELSASSLMLKVAQWELFLLLIMLFNQSYFDQSIMFRMLKTTAIIATSYMIIQQIIATVFHIYLAPGITILPYVDESFKSVYASLVRWGKVYRPRSFFSEPATYCQFMLFPIVIEIFDEKIKTKKDIIYLIFLILGIIISKSGTGFMCLAAIGVLYFFLKLKRGNILISIQKLFLIIIALILMAFAFNSTGFQYIYNRFFAGDGLLSNLMGQTRFTGLFDFKAMNMNSLTDILIGKGFTMEQYTQADAYYLGGLVRQFYCFGLVGIVILFTLLYSIYIKGNAMQKAIVIIFVILNTGSNALHCADILVPLAFASYVNISTKKEERKT